MQTLKKRLFREINIVLLGIGLALFLVKLGIIHNFILSLGNLQWLGIILAGFFFTSIFTTAPSIALLASFSQTTPLWVMFFLGGLGAVLGDLVIFIFVRKKILKNFDYLLTSQEKRIPLIFKKGLFKFFLPFLGALIIASPLPDELGVSLLGLSKISKKHFLVLSFLLNGAGILVISSLAKVIGGN